jgi:hypothetical protein
VCVCVCVCVCVRERERERERESCVTIRLFCNFPSKKKSKAGVMARVRTIIRLTFVSAG